MTRSHSALDRSTSAPKPPTPALSTATSSTAEGVVDLCRTAVTTSSSTEMSHRTKSSACPDPGWTSSTATRAPAPRRSSTVADPIPLAPPVTSADAPSSSTGPPGSSAGAVRPGSLSTSAATSGRSRARQCPASGISTRRAPGIEPAHVRAASAGTRRSCSPRTTSVGTRTRPRRSVSFRLWKCGAFHPRRAAPASPANHSSCCSVVMVSGSAPVATGPSGSAKRRRRASPAPPMPRGATAPKNGGTSTPAHVDPEGIEQHQARHQVGAPQGELGREPPPEAVADDGDGASEHRRRRTGRRGGTRSPPRRRGPRARCWRCSRGGRAPRRRSASPARPRNGVHSSPGHTAWTSHNPCRYSSVPPPPPRSARLTSSPRDAPRGALRRRAARPGRSPTRHRPPSGGEVPARRARARRARPRWRRAASSAP